MLHFKKLSLEVGSSLSYILTKKELAIKCKIFPILPVDSGQETVDSRQ